MPLFAESWESLIAFVVILLLSGLGNWLRQRKAPPPESWTDEEEAPSPRPGRPRPEFEESRPTPPAFDLERELRRMLGEEPPASPPPPPPVIVTAPVETRPPPRAPAPVIVPEDLEQRPAPGFELAAVAEAQAAYQRAGAIDANAQALLEAAKARAAQHRASLAGPHRDAHAPEVAAVLAALRSPRTARQAILASIILGPPKAFAEEPAGYQPR
jgi:hypothetical protein